ncbi:MAG: Unknown protein [uncultured Sulfurovum sp.]|uniref:Autotransporter adhesin n=1 Tax=uncultured Sulfurovum sp. TaxID=269237 RepID=A0A6S6TH49_9BACT|nr:MAG: Unknown protein [uncultured Sulfurovum sp.]
MKKLIVTSIATSMILFAANVDGLDMDQENRVQDSKINAAIIMQGKTEIWGEADVTGLTVKSKDRGNIIEHSIINGAANLDFQSNEFMNSEYYDRELDDSIVTQGRTKVINGKVNNVSIDSDSVINDETTINAATGNSVTIDQGFTLVDGYGQELTDAHIKSDNRISNVDIEGESVGSTTIRQANFKMINEGAASSAKNINIDSTNVIEGGKIGHAIIKQASTELKNGAIAENFDLVQENIISGDTEIKEFSEVSQGVIKVDNSKISSLEQSVQNIISDVQGDSSSAVDSKIVQSEIDVQNNSDLSLTQLAHTNIIRSSELVDSTITQDTILVTDNSVVQNFTQEADSLVHHVEAENSEILQNAMVVINSTIDSRNASTSKQNNIVSDTDLTDARVGQAMVYVKDSQVMDLMVSEENVVTDSSLHNAYVTQGELLISSL